MSNEQIRLAETIRRCEEVLDEASSFNTDPMDHVASLLASLGEALGALRVLEDQYRSYGINLGVPANGPATNEGVLCVKK